MRHGRFIKTALVAVAAMAIGPATAMATPGSFTDDTSADFGRRVARDRHSVGRAWFCPASADDEDRAVQRPGPSRRHDRNALAPR